MTDHSQSLIVSHSQWGEQPIGPLRTAEQLELACQPSPGPSRAVLRKLAILSIAEGRRLVHLEQLEKSLQEDLRQAVMVTSGGPFPDWLYYHTHRSTHSPAGYPDTHICGYGRGYGRSLFVECKRESEEVDGFQELWLWTLMKAGHEVYILRPSGFSAFLEALK